MTLLLGALTPRYVVQVADRRVTTGKSWRDGFVKAVLTRKTLCSYTGVAELGPRRDTAKWIAEILTRHGTDTDAGMEAVATALNGQFTKRYAGMPHAVAFSGWKAVGHSEAERSLPPIPWGTAIANFDPVTFEVWPRFMRMDYELRPARLSTLWHWGQAVREDESVPAARALERLCVSGRDSPRAIAQVLTECVRTVSRNCAEKYDSREPTVSEDVLVISWPRPDLATQGGVVGYLSTTGMSVTCIPAGTRQEMPGGPILVGPGSAMRPLEPGEGLPRGHTDKPGDVHVGIERIVKTREGVFPEMGVAQDPETKKFFPFWSFPVRRP